MSDTTHPEVPGTTIRSPNASTAPAAPAAASSQSSLGEFPEELLNEWRWIFAARERGDFDSYRGQHVAVMNGKILGSGYDPQLLVELLALKHNLDPKRIVTVYVGNW
ncbi:MAG TPA: hypothetical protein VMG10_11405 [Gemmataceae bacterium]|nr:hypothetical protein [Gemmataceae bacterium]